MSKKAGTTNHQRAVERKEKERIKRERKQIVIDRLHSIISNPVSTTEEILKAVELLTFWEGG